MAKRKKAAKRSRAKRAAKPEPKKEVNKLFVYLGYFGIVVGVIVVALLLKSIFV